MTAFLFLKQTRTIYQSFLPIVPAKSTSTESLSAVSPLAASVQSDDSDTSSGGCCCDGGGIQDDINNEDIEFSGTFEIDIEVVVAKNCKSTSTRSDRIDSIDNYSSESMDFLSYFASKETKQQQQQLQQQQQQHQQQQQQQQQILHQPQHHQLVSSTSSASLSGLKNQTQVNHQPHNVLPHPPTSTSYDIEEATPPPSSHRYDPSRRRTVAHHAVLNASVHGLDDQHLLSSPVIHPQQQQQTVLTTAILDDDNRSVCSLPKAPLSGTTSGRVTAGGMSSGVLPLTINSVQQGPLATSSSVSSSSNSVGTVTNKTPEPKLIHP
jgi:hypothetical protein